MLILITVITISPYFLSDPENFVTFLPLKLAGSIKKTLLPFYTIYLQDIIECFPNGNLCPIIQYIYSCLNRVFPNDN